MANSLMVIKPYQWEGIWVFDDETTGLVKEALVAGTDKILEGLCNFNNIPMESAKKGFRLIFSETPFPGWQLHAKHDKSDVGDGDLGSDQVFGNWYEVVDMLDHTGKSQQYVKGMKGWLCPALFKYFDHTPKNLYAKAEEIKD